jgi:hypothetical protein
MTTAPVGRPTPLDGAALAWLTVGAVARWAREWARRQWRAATGPLGRRGSALIAFGLGYVFHGIRLSGPQGPDDIVSFGPAAQVLPVGVWGAVFVGAGLAAMLAGVLHDRAPRTLAFAALAGLAGLWGVSTLMAVVVDWTAPLTWLLVVLPLLLIVAGVGESRGPP